MDRYVRVEQPKTEQAPILENEVRIMSAGKMRNYIAYATTLLKEKGHKSVLLKGMGRAINKTVTIAEIVKRRISGLHQNTAIGSVDITDTWEPLEEGLSRLETTRHVSVISITLSCDALDESLPGYQQPLPEEEVKTLPEGGGHHYHNSGPRVPRGGGPGRGGRGMATAGGGMGAGGPPGGGRGRGRGRGRSSGRGGRNGGRGGRGPPMGGYYQEGVGPQQYMRQPQPPPAVE